MDCKNTFDKALVRPSRSPVISAKAPHSGRWNGPELGRKHVTHPHKKLTLWRDRCLSHGDEGEGIWGRQLMIAHVGKERRSRGNVGVAPSSTWQDPSLCPRSSLSITTSTPWPGPRKAPWADPKKRPARCSIYFQSYLVWSEEWEGS